MENAMMIAAIVGPLYLIIGLSVLFYGKAWQKLIDGWQDDHLSLFPLMFFYIVFGLFIVNTYNVWEWNVWLLVTLTGWMMLVKGTLYMLMPGSVTASLLDMKGKGAMLYIAGLVCALIGAVLSYYAYMV